MLNEQAATLPPNAPTSEELSIVATEPNPAAEQLMQLQMLSQAPLSLEEALEQEAAVTGDVEAAPATITGLLLRAAAQLALFVGVGLVAAAVVHHGDDPKLYSLLALGGGALFAGGSVASAKQATQSGVVAALIYGATSLALGLGVGLLLGGILHYSAAPHQSTVTIPLGLVVAIAALFARDGRALIGKEMVPTAVTIVGLLVWLSIGLGFGAKKLDPPAVPGSPVAEHAAPAAEGHGAAAAGDHGGAAAESAGAATGADAASAAGGHGKAAAADGHGAATTAGSDAAPAAAAGGHDAAPSAAAKADAHGAAAADEHKASADKVAAAPAAEAHAAGY